MSRPAAAPAPRPIVFAHGNGFPAGTYRVLFERWRAAGHAVHALERFGHDPRYPVTSNWARLRDELIAFVDAETGPGAFFVGHSLGGLLALLAACKRPELPRGIVMLDSPVVSGWRAHSISVLKATGLIRRVSPGRVARSRRHAWPDRAALRRHFAAKQAFARWDPRVLDDYLASGFVDAGDGVHLAFRREVEAQIYDAVPHHFDRVLARHPPRCPVAFVAGTRSVEIRQAGMQASRRLAGERFAWIEGSHLYPMECPDETADTVLAMLATMP